MYIEQKGSGEDLVFFHGWGLNGAVWNAITPLLENRYRLHLVDLPGFGLSRDVYQAKADLDLWIEQILPHLPERFVLLGWSMGGLLAQQIAIRFPERVTSLVLIASTPAFLQKEDWPGIRPEVLQGFHQALQKDVAKTVERFLAIQAMGSDSVREDVKRLKGWLQDRPLAHPTALDVGLDFLSDIDLRTHVSSILCPVFGIFGRLDSLVPVDAVNRMSLLYPSGFTSVIMPHVAHAPFISHPEIFVEHLCVFLHEKRL